MDTSALKNFAQESRRYLMDVVSKKIQYYLTTDNVEIRAKKHLVEELKKEIANSSKEQVIEKIAYTWFNRFCALRYMDVKQYSLVGVLTPMSESHTQPEILMEAKSGHIKDELGNSTSRDNVIGLLSGKVSSNDPQSEAYKLLVLMACNYYHSIMPFLFEKIDDYTELLMPDDLLSEASIISKAREALNDENCKDVEVIGWLYQFYISEKKDEVFEGLKKNKKITPENIPAATQLFTPNWIVRYLVENSLGRLWMLNRPKSNLISKMEYYIKPETEEKDFLKIKGPEEIKVCDPACGSGHMLVYAFDLLYSMYEEEGVDSNEIPSLILKNNLFGIEIDKRAGELAAFALTMKAREKQRRYFKKPVNPNICVLENIHFEESEINDYMDHVGHDLFSGQLRNTLTQFEEAKNFGSLIRPEVSDVDNILNLLDQKNVSGHLFLTQTHAKVLRILSQVKFLSPIYHVVIANPPYMGGKGMNGVLSSWAKDNYPESKYDLFGMFIERNITLGCPKALIGIITLPSWLFLSSFEKLRISLLNNNSFHSLLHMGRGIFGIDWGSVAFVVMKDKINLPGAYFRLHKRNFQHIYFEDIAKIFKRTLSNSEYQFNFDLYRDEDGVIEIPLNGHPDGQRIFYQASAKEFRVVPGSPISYWMSPQIRHVFENGVALKTIGDTRQGMATSDNNRFLRFWPEVSISRMCMAAGSHDEAINSLKKWFPYNKGGNFRKWYGNSEFLVNWEENGKEILAYASSLYGSPTRTVKSISEYFKPSISWSKISSGDLAMRYYPKGYLFDVAGCCIFTPDDKNLMFLLGYSNSIVAKKILELISPTLNFEAGQIAMLPVLQGQESDFINFAKSLIKLSKNDWDSSETSWGFKNIPLLDSSHRCSSLQDTYFKVRHNWLGVVQEMKRLEEDNNRAYIEFYCLQDELSYKVPLNEITLTCSPHYRYGGDKTDKELETLLLADTIREFISYSVGCMFGRYSLDKDGLILANQGETLKDYLKQIPKPTFVPDEDNIIPILDGDWFIDEISERFKQFLKITFGEDNFVENLKFIEEAIGKDIRKYFVKDFYNDHVKMYKKRQIYWLFSSPKGTFNALMYMHRYTPDTVSIVLNNYLREFRTKLNSKRENLERLSVAAATSARDKTAALKEIEQLKKMIVELDEYEKDILYPLATQRLEIDLDDGVKANYPKFGKALKPIKGLEEDEE